DLRREIERLEEILGSETVLRALVSEELAAVAAEHGDSRRTVLLEAAEKPAVAAGASLEVADEPCRVLLTGTGLVARLTGQEPLLREGPRGAHDVIVSDALTSTRSTVGVVTDRGRVLRLSVVDLPSLAPTAGAPSLAGGTRIADLIDLDREEHALGLIRLDEADIARGGAIALGTRQGVVKRVQLDFPRSDGFEIISLKDGDAVVGVVDLEQDEDLDLVFLTAEAQLLHFPASGIRPQGRTAGGVAGIKLTGGDRVVSFGAIDVTAPADVVTVAGSSDTLPLLQTGSLKVTALTEFPAKGRATAGMRCHRFLRGEAALIGAWVVPHPARASSEAGQPIDLPEPTGRRDGSGTPVAAPIAAVGCPWRARRRGTAPARGRADDERTRTDLGHSSADGGLLACLPDRVRPRPPRRGRRGHRPRYRCGVPPGHRSPGRLGLDRAGRRAVGVRLRGVTAAVVLSTLTRRSLPWFGGHHRWRRMLDVGGLSLVYGLLGLFLTGALFAVFQKSFQGVALDRVAGTFWVAAASAAGAYIASASAAGLTGRSLATLLAVFVTVGVLASAMNAPDPYWWERYFSELGEGQDLAS